jgi:hypothetical protein
VAACDRAGACVAEVCPAVDAAAGAQLAINCVPGCDPADSGWIMATGCQAIVDAIAGADPAFATFCHGEAPACPGADRCAPYGDKVAGCFVAQCGGAAAPFEVGLAAALRDWCLGGADCPPPAAVDGVLAAEVTCQTPPLDAVGQLESLAPLCAPPADLTTALQAGCAALKACPGTDWVESVDLCMVLLGMRPDAAGRAACLSGAAGDCAAVFACLEGL